MDFVGRKVMSTRSNDKITSILMYPAVQVACLMIDYDKEGIDFLLAYPVNLLFGWSKTGEGTGYGGNNNVQTGQWP
jgi:hypothetical protein